MAPLSQSLFVSSEPHDVSSFLSFPYSLLSVLKPFPVRFGLVMFWASYPWWKHWTCSLFSSFPLSTTEAATDPPQGTRLLSLSRKGGDRALLSRICHFLALHFAPTSAHPILHHTPETLLGQNDLLLVLLSESESKGNEDRKEKETIIGTLRYHAIGTFQITSHVLYLVDAFCIHPAWRKKGLATFLLATLRTYANFHKRPNALFLKEGTPLPYLVPPVLSGKYVYCAIPPSPSPSPSTCHTRLLPLSCEKAHRWMSHYLVSFPDTLLVVPSSSLTITWFAYRRPPCSVLIGVQDTHQTWRGGPIGWVTVWLETPMTIEEDRKIITRELIHSLSLSSSYRWIWMNQDWIGTPMEPEWKEDGPFQWYTYQWATRRGGGRSYGIPG